MPVPSDADVVKLAQDKYSELIDAYAGITEDNMDEVTKKLGDLGVLPESEVPQAPGRKRTRREVVNLVASKMADVLSLVSDLAVPDVINNTQLVVSAHRPPLTVPELPAPPAWASSLRKVAAISGCSANNTKVLPNVYPVVSCPAMTKKTISAMRCASLP